jgi:hypothetical protein
VDGIEPGQRPIMGLVISDAEPAGSATRDLFRYNAQHILK